MSELIGRQLVSMIVMVYCGMACGLVYQVFTWFRDCCFRIAEPTDGEAIENVSSDAPSRSRFFCVLDVFMEIFSLILIGYCISAFLYYSSWGKISPQDVVCFFMGLWLWRKVYGQEGKQTPGIREEQPGAGYQRRTGSPEKEKRKEKRQTRR